MAERNALASKEPSIQSIPVQNKAAQLAAYFLGGLNEGVSKPFGYENEPVRAITNFLGVPAAVKTLENAAYGLPNTTGTGTATQLRPEAKETLANALMTLPLGRVALKGGEKVTSALSPKLGDMLEGYASKTGVLLEAGPKKKVQTVTIPATTDFFEGVGIPEKKVFADIDKLYRKHPDVFQNPEDVQNHLTYVFSGKPTYTLPAGDPNFNLIVRQASDFPPDSPFAYRAAAADFRPSEKQQYWVKTALPMPESQVQWKLIKEAEGRLAEPVVKLKRPQDEK